MSKYTEMSKRLLDLIGGKDNIRSVTHCATRLRIRLCDEDNVDIDAVKKLPGVLGVQKNVGEIQVIIGPTVEDAYQEFLKIGDFELSKKETVKSEERKTGLKAIMNTIFATLTGCISPIVYAFVVMGMFKSVSAIFGPSMFGFFTAESDLYILLEGIGNSITYFLPFLLAYSASQKLGANTVISMVLAGIMLSPAITSVVSAGEPFKVFGMFPMALINYSSTFLPVLLVVAVQVYVEKLLTKAIPDVVKTVLVPTLTVAVMTVLGLCVLGPIGQWLGDGLANVVMLLGEYAGWLEGALVAALYVFMVAFGLGGPVFLATFAVYMQTGTDSLYFPYMCIYGMALVGIGLGYIIRSKSAAEKQTGMVALTSQLLGGVSEPSIYGILFRNKRCLIIEVIASGIAGFYCGLTHTAVIGMTFALPVVGPFLAFTGNSTANMVNGSISLVIAFVLALVGTLVCYRDETVE